MTEMTNISNLPEDVLLGCFCGMKVDDILRSERVCVKFRYVIGSKHLWLSKLRELDRVCAPDVPQYVDLTTLPCSKLRDIVVRAFRSYYQMVKGKSPKAEYPHVKTIVADRPNHLTNDEGFKVESAKVVPGGRFIFLQCIATRYNELRLLDMDCGDKCLWALDMGTVSEDSINIHPIVHYEFFVQPDGSMTMALGVVGESGVSSSNVMVLHLSPITIPGQLQHSIIFFSAEQDVMNLYGEQCAVTNKFAAFGFEPDILMIIDCERKQSAKFAIPELEMETMDVQIWNEHLFYIVRSSLGCLSLCAFSIPKAMSKTRGSPIAIKLDTSLISQFTPMRIKDYNRVAALDYSLYGHPVPCREDSRSVAVSTVFVTYNRRRVPRFVSARAVFDAEQSVERKWSSITSHTVKYSPEKYGSIGLESRLSRSGRILASILAAGFQDVGPSFIIALDKEGKAVLPEVPENILPGPVWLNDRRNEDEDDLKDLNITMDPYSGTLVVCGKGANPDTVHLYRPA